MILSCAVSSPFIFSSYFKKNFTVSSFALSHLSSLSISLSVSSFLLIVCSTWALSIGFIPTIFFASLMILLTFEFLSSILRESLVLLGHSVVWLLWLLAIHPSGRFLPPPSATLLAHESGFVSFINAISSLISFTSSSSFFIFGLAASFSFSAMSCLSFRGSTASWISFLTPTLTDIAISSTSPSSLLATSFLSSNLLASSISLFHQLPSVSPLPPSWSLTFASETRPSSFSFLFSSSFFLSILYFFGFLYILILQKMRHSCSLDLNKFLCVPTCCLSFSTRVTSGMCFRRPHLVIVLIPKFFFSDLIYLFRDVAGQCW